MCGPGTWLFPLFVYVLNLRLREFCSSQAFRNKNGFLKLFYEKHPQIFLYFSSVCTYNCKYIDGILLWCMGLKQTRFRRIVVICYVWSEDMLARQMGWGHRTRTRRSWKLSRFLCSQPLPAHGNAIKFTRYHTPLRTAIRTWNNNMETTTTQQKWFNSTLVQVKALVYELKTKALSGVTSWLVPSIGLAAWSNFLVSSGH